MRANSGIYPALGRFFDSLDDLADAGCMSRTRAHECMTGQKDLTLQEKKAIVNDIIVRFSNGEIDKTYEGIRIEDLLRARTEFDEVFKEAI